MKEFLNKKIMNKEWKRFIKKEEYVDYLSFYKSLQNTAKCMMIQMLDFLFIDDIYVAFLELAEVVNNIDIMLSTKNLETERLCKERVDFMLSRKALNWYI